MRKFHRVLNSNPKLKLKVPLRILNLNLNLNRNRNQNQNQNLNLVHQDPTHHHLQMNKNNQVLRPLKNLKVCNH